MEREEGEERERENLREKKRIKCFRINQGTTAILTRLMDKINSPTDRV